MTNVAPFTALCPGCFADKGNASLCPHCGYDESLKRGPLVLAHRTLLHHGQYLIGRVLGKPGGFGITYLALDTKLETRVAIKEYLPRDLAGRDAGHATISAHSAEDGEFFRYGLTQFLQEARTLAQFDHANIVRVRNFFEENSTGYLVMDYYDGVTLADYLAQQPQGRLPEKTAVGILMPILDGLREVHAKNFLHRDIKPQNIYLTTGNRPILLDFGAARQAMGERSRSLSVVLSEGYAPYEQYHRRGEQGPWTDIYACAAVLYHAVAGEAPPPATERVHKDELDIDALGLSASLTNALRLGLAADHHSRPQRMMEFQALLLGSGEAGVAKTGEQRQVSAPENIERPRPVDPNQGEGRRNLKLWWAPVLAAIVVIAMMAMGTKEEGTTVPTAVVPAVVVVKPEPIPVATSGSEHVTHGAVTYEKEVFIGGGIYKRKMDRLVVKLDGKRLPINIEALRDQSDNEANDIAIDARDFDGDGVMDAFISIYSGGNAITLTSMFVSVIDGRIIAVPADFYPEGVVEEGGRSFVTSLTDDATDYWSFDGTKVIKVRSKPHRKLETIAEIQNDSDVKGTFVADLDLDGKPDKISCSFWSRYNAYDSCTLPLPDGTTQEINFQGTDFFCRSVGALKTQSNGFRELVCRYKNINAVIRFNGNTWVRHKPLH